MLTGQDRARITQHRDAFDIESELVLVSIDSPNKIAPAKLTEIEQALLAIPEVDTTLSAASANEALSSASAENTRLILLLLAPASPQLDAAKALSPNIRETVEGLLGADESSSIIGLPQTREASWIIGERDARMMLPLLLAATLLVTQLCFKSYIAIGLSLLLTSLTTSICLALQLMLGPRSMRCWFWLCR
jgi:hypothetical protein